MREGPGELSVRREDRPAGRDAPARRAASPPPARSRSSRAATPPRGLGALAAAGRVTRACLRRPGPLVTVVVLLGATAAVSMNALRNQSGRHPAPLFSEARPAPTPARSRLAQAPVAPVPPPTTAPTPQVAQPPQSPRRDPIGELIRSDATTTASTGPKAEADVRLAQRALAKLGYGSLKPDGLMGAETRMALERFERERKLPATGQAAGRTLRTLAQAAGLTAAPTPSFPSTGDGVIDPKTID